MAAAGTAVEEPSKRKLCLYAPIFFLTSLPSNSKSGSFHVLRLNNRCMINQTWMHMSAFFFFFFLCHCTSNMLILLSHLLFLVHPISALVLN